jgi:hypothetical protein
MDEVPVGTRWDPAGVPLPAALPAGPRASMTALLSPTGELLVDEATDPVLVEVAGVAAQSRAATTAVAGFEARLVDAYLWGAAEYACRRPEPSEQARREWGARLMLAELAVALHLPEGSLARRLTRTTMLGAFPRLSAAYGEGRVSSWHVDTVLDAFRGVTDPEVLARADEALADRAVADTAPRLRAAARRWRARNMPRDPEQHRRAVADRFVEVTPADDDLCWLTALLPAATAMAAYHRLSGLAVAAGGPGDDRTLPQRRADVLADLLLDGGSGVPSMATSDDEQHDDGQRDEGQSDDAQDDEGQDDDAQDDEGLDDRDDAAGAGDGSREPCVPRGLRPDIVLTVPVLSLLGHGDEPAELEGFGPIDLETARALCAQAPSFVRVLTHP